MNTRTEIPTSPSCGAAYGFYCTLGKNAFADAVDPVIDPLTSGGFGSLTDIDVQATRTAQPNIGFLLTCNVTVREDAGANITFSFRAR